MQSYQTRKILSLNKDIQKQLEQASHFCDKKSLLMDQKGNTALHLAITRCAGNEGIQSLNNFIKNTSVEDLAKMVRTVNNNGLLPMNLLAALVEEGELSADDSKEILKKLLPHASGFQIKNISSPVEMKCVLASYPAKPNSELHKNLVTACLIANETRKLITKSSSHPEVNDNSLHSELVEQIASMRDKRNHILEKLQLDIHSKRQDAYLKIFVKFIKLFGNIGNCLEYSHVALYLLTQLAPTASGTLVRFTNDSNADHWFMVIGHGKNAVICDAWSGEVYPISAMSEKLKAFTVIYSQNKAYNCLLEFNPSYHQLKAEYSVNAKKNSLLTKIGLLFERKTLPIKNTDSVPLTTLSKGAETRL